MSNLKHDRTRLTAISPLDGRYRNLIEDLVPFTSEMALIKTRVEIEARYLIELSEYGMIRQITDHERHTLITIGQNMTIEQIGRVKEIEDATRHDVKAMERALREFLAGTSLEDITEMIHFGLTSEDVNNLSYRLMLDRARTEVVVPTLYKVVDGFVKIAKKYKSLPMIGRTHGQFAVPTTLGKEMANIAVRLNRQISKLQQIKLTGKLNGAVGNFNAHVLAASEVDWIAFSQKFVKSLGLEPNLFTTQINPYDDMIEIFQTFQRINGVLLDGDNDMWRYISDDWFTQKVQKDEVGSSTMPQKINPIDFENSEGNLQLANSIWEGMDRKLAVSRLQRDLSDSTTVRNIGVGLGHGLLAYRNTLAGLSRVHPNIKVMQDVLNENWTILTEGVQTVLRQAGEQDPYSMVADLSKGKKIGKSEWQDWIDELSVNDNVNGSLRDLTPQTYLGHAERLTDMALEEIAHSKKGRN